ncbi:DUF4169 family protein [Bartonella tamiae]
MLLEKINNHTMNDITNLRQFRKKKQLEKEEQLAEQNRHLFGRTKAEKQFDLRLKIKNKRLNEVARLDKDQMEQHKINDVMTTSDEHD